MDERLKDRLAFLGSLASGLAHEIKNPLSTMTITLGLLREDLETSDSPRDRRLLKKIHLLEGEVSRLEHILQDFLQFAGGHVVRPQLVSVNGWLGELLDFFEPSLTEAHVKLVRRLAPKLPAVLVDRELMKQAVLNLLTNAKQAMGKGGELTVKTWTSGDRVRIDVSDTGEGIPPDVLPRIWEVYFSTKEHGTGLGLPTVRRIVAEHGGEVTVESRAGRGTCFSVFLPVPPTIVGSETRRLPGARADSLTSVLAPDAGEERSS
jgi:two-component system sensor histidine kinase HydH